MLTDWVQLMLLQDFAQVLGKQPLVSSVDMKAIENKLLAMRSDTRNEAEYGHAMTSIRKNWGFPIGPDYLDRWHANAAH